MQNVIAFEAGETVKIIGAETECECSHCGRPLKVGVRLAGFGGVFGSDCLAKAFDKQKVGPYIQKLAPESIRQRAIIARKGQEYASRCYGWNVDGPNFFVTLKSALRSV